MKFFDADIKVRLRKAEKEYLKHIFNTYPGRFENPSHVARCAILRFINTEKKDKELWKKWHET